MLGHNAKKLKRNAKEGFKLGTYIFRLVTSTKYLLRLTFAPKEIIYKLTCSCELEIRVKKEKLG